MNNLRKGAEHILNSATSIADESFNNPKRMSKDFGITGSTFRAYRSCSTSPSLVYKNWVNNNGYAIIGDFSSNHRSGFTELHQRLTQSLEKSWSESGNRDLTVSEKYKLVDLFCKAVAFSIDHPCLNSREFLYKHANIPLDKFSLLLVKKLYFGIVISKNPSMGDIDSLETYLFLQDMIYKTTEALNIPNLVFDILAWNETH
jgi:hypothetical protein